MKSKAYRYALVLMIACSLIACDQDGSTDPIDTSTDTTPDVTPDATPDVPPDVTPDATPDPEPDPVPDSTGTYAVSGTLSRTYDTCPPLGDASGTLCLSFRTSCTDPTSEVVAAEAPSITIYMPGDSAAWATGDVVPDGSYQLYAFLDDDGSGCAAISSGDMFSGDGCAAVEVAGADVTGVTLVFNNKQP